VPVVERVVSEAVFRVVDRSAPPSGGLGTLGRVPMPRIVGQGRRLRSNHEPAAVHRRSIVRRPVRLWAAEHVEEGAE
jgi:hypothetical protein